MKNMLGVALALVTEAFKHRVDKGGIPYALHCIHVMLTCGLKDEDELIAALLHDIVEDIPYITIEYLRNMGFSERTLKILELLTHDPADDYLEVYIKKIAYNYAATQIKLADLRHNSDITRIKGVRKKDFDRIEKYHKAFIYLSN